MSAKTPRSGRSAGGSGSGGDVSAPATASPRSGSASLVPPASSGGGGRSGRAKPPSFESLLVEEAMSIEAGEDIAVTCVGEIVQAAMNKLTEHYLQQVAMNNTAKQAIDFVMQAIEWQLLAHDDGEKLTVRKVLSEKVPSTDEVESADDRATAAAESALLAAAPSPITEPHNRSKPALDIVASKLSLPTTYNQIWTCEDEPPPADLDKWARGVIPTKPSAPTTTTINLGGTLGGSFVVHEADEQDTPRSTSAASTTSSRYGGGGGGHFRSPTSGSTRGGSAHSHAGGGSVSGSHHRKSRSIVEEKEAPPAKPVPFALETTITKEAALKERAREAELRRLEKKKKGEREVAALRAADAAERERMERIQAELRHRSYTFDNRGNVVLINPAPAERFPSFQATPVVRVKDEFLTDEQEAEIAKREKRNRFKKTAVNSRPSTTAGAATAVPPIHAPTGAVVAPAAAAAAAAGPASPQKSHDIGIQKKKPKKAKPDMTGFVDLSATQPSLMQTLTLAKGVTLKQGAASKTFDPRAATTTSIGEAIDNASAELRGLPRHAYLAKVAQKRQADATFLPPSTPLIGGAPGISLSRPGSSANIAQRANNGSDADGQAPTSPRSSIGNLGTTGELDPSELEWGSEADHETYDAYDDDGDYVDGGRSVPGARGVGGAGATSSWRRPTTGESFNRQLTQDPSWGQNPALSAAALLVPRPPPPSRPTEAERLLVLGRRTKAPRDRVGVDQLTSQPATRKHLPPAPFGKTTGHGLEVAGGVGEASDAAEREQSRSATPSSPTRPFTKLPPPTTVTATAKAKLYFKQQQQ